jgi:hypothetical protein
VLGDRGAGGPARSAYPPAFTAAGLVPGTFAVMDLLEVAAGPNRMVTFDGRVLEVFGGSGPGHESAVPSAAAICPIACSSAGLTLCPCSLWAAATLPARVSTKRR